MKKFIGVSVPMTPNFIKVGTVMYPLTEFTEAELREIGKEWTNQLIKKAHRRRNIE